MTPGRAALLRGTALVGLLVLLALPPQDGRVRVVVFRPVQHAVGDRQVQAGSVPAADERGQVRGREEEPIGDEAHCGIRVAG